MTNDQINTAIATKLGIPLVETKWKFMHWSSGSEQWKVSSGGYHSEEHARKEITYLEGQHSFICSDPVSYEEKMTTPDYCSDLNLCHEVEMSLDDDCGKSLFTDREKFRRELHKVMVEQGHRDSNERIHATAQQRALALCKTWGLEV